MRLWLAGVSAVSFRTVNLKEAAAKITFVSDAPQLTAAVQATLPGDGIIVAPGRYAVRLRFTDKNAGTHGAPVLVSSRDGPCTVIIDSAASGADITVKFTAASYIRLEGLDITGGGFHGFFLTRVRITSPSMEIGFTTISQFSQWTAMLN